MKNQYFGDINDYRKYGVLRCFADTGWRVGVCWMLTPDDGRPDGRKIAYLKDRRRWQPYDPGLFDALSSALSGRDGRHVRHAENGILLPRAAFFGAPVPHAAAAREKWFGKAMKALGHADLLFFDPDNGVEVPSTRRGRKNSSKYLYWDEISQSWSTGASLLIFQHFPREKRDPYIARVVATLARQTTGSSVRCLRTANVLFLLAHRVAQRRRVAAALRAVRSKWPKQVWECDGAVDTNE